MWISYFFCVIKHKPVAMGRPRFSRYTGRAYTPDKTRKALAEIAHNVAQAMEAQQCRQIDKTTPIHVDLVFVHPRPKSHKKTTERSPKTTKPDIDRLVNTYFDGMTKGGLLDDNHITSLKAEDLYGATGEEPHVIINVSIWRGTDDKTWLHHSQI